MTDTLKSLRIQNGFTQAEVAEKLSVTTPTVSSWERGTKPSPKYIPKLAKLYGTDPRQIFLLTNTTKVF